MKDYLKYGLPLMDKHLNSIGELIRKYEKEHFSKTINQHVQTLLDRNFIQSKHNEMLLEKEKNRQPYINSIGHLVGSQSTLISEAVIKLVKSGISSATEISQIIRKAFTPVNQELSVGVYKRPRIYYDVLLILKTESEKGHLYFDLESSDMDDCYFYIEIDENRAKQVKIESNEFLQTTLF